MDDIYEVECKYPVDDLPRVEIALARMGAKIGAPVRQTDKYFAHPSRDFAATDEALRIRVSGEENYITYKGPKVDATTKTRREIDFLLPSDPVE